MSIKPKINVNIETRYKHSRPHSLLPLTTVPSAKNLHLLSPLNKGINFDLPLLTQRQSKVPELKDTFMKDLLGFRLKNATAFSHKAFGTERLSLPWNV